MEEENRYLIVYVCNDRDLINLDMQIVKAESLYDAANYITGYELYSHIVKEDLNNGIMVMHKEERIPIFDEEYKDKLEKVYFDYCYILNIDNVDTFSEDIDIAYFNHKHGILDTKEYRCLD